MAERDVVSCSISYFFISEKLDTLFDDLEFKKVII